jgi:hypothetical protein
MRPIELCSSATPFVACGAEVGLKAGGCFLLLFHRPSHLVLLVHAECVGEGGFWLAPRNLQPNPIAAVCLAADSFLNDEG